jgi:hypothetical protein
MFILKMCKEHGSQVGTGLETVTLLCSEALFLLGINLQYQLTFNTLHLKTRGSESHLDFLLKTESFQNLLLKMHFFESQKNTTKTTYILHTALRHNVPSLLAI